MDEEPIETSFFPDNRRPMLEVTRPPDDRQGGVMGLGGISSPPDHSVEQTGTGGRPEGDGRPISFGRSRSKAQTVYPNLIRASL